MKKARTHFARLDWIILSLTILFGLFEVIVALCLDATGLVMKSTNPIAKLAHAMGFASINGSAPAWILLLVLDFYGILLVAALLFEYRMADFYDHCHWNKKWATVYGVTVLICVVFGFGIGCCAQYPFTAEYFGNSFLFVGETFGMGLLLYVGMGLLVSCLVLLVINVFGLRKSVPAKMAAIDAEDDEKATPSEQSNGSLPASLGVVSSQQAIGLMAQYDQAQTTLKAKAHWDKEQVFPGLAKIDYEETGAPAASFTDEGTLQDIAEGFRNYLAKDRQLYFSLATIRSFIAGLNASRLVILQGLSGTGKSSLARYWSAYLGESSFFEPVQATWRDRTSLLGYFNDFSSTYHETEFLKRLYRASYEVRRQNVMVLDEINIARIEYYFADFLSVLEYPQAEWRLKILELPLAADAPAHLSDGVIAIPANTWFIGTANTDDSTFTITDKVVDRAIVIDFAERNEPFEVKAESKPLHLSNDYLQKLFQEAMADPQKAFTATDYQQFKGLLDVVDERFGVVIGNRIIRQISLFVPVYLACGGSKEAALDFFFAEKVVSKLKGRYEGYVKAGLLALEEEIGKRYGKSFEISLAAIERILRKLS